MTNLINIDNLAPIVLFIYNRPWHTEQTLNALSQNLLAKNSTLYIFADGPKQNASVVDLKKIKEVRSLIRAKKWCKEVIIHESSENKGLASSIIFGVTKIIDIHRKIIVLEDDIIPEKGFLRYMNEALEMYKNEDQVGCIHAWNYNMNTFSRHETTFFLRGADCWGWATWKKSWMLFESNTEVLIEKIKKMNTVYNFNRNNTIDFFQMLRDQQSGKIDSWAIRWHASLYLNDKYCLYPVKPIVKNIGLDGSGTHNTSLLKKQRTTKYINLKKIPIIEHELFFKGFKKNKTTLYQNLISIFKKTIKKQSTT